MSKRPAFNEIKSYEQFCKYYWYRNELSSICKSLGIHHYGTKQELNEYIKEYFKGNVIPITKSTSLHSTTKTIELTTPLLSCGFAFNNRFREYFSKVTGIKNFKFNANMATAWRKVKKDQDMKFTMQDMLDIYYQKSDYAKYDDSSCQWNTFLKDFCNDPQNSLIQNKMKVASIVWNEVKNSTDEKIYTPDLMNKYYKK